MKISIFGESHGPAIGVLIESPPSGLKLDIEAVLAEMARRAPGRSDISTSRQEPDAPEIISGLHGDHTTGGPLCAMIRNRDARSRDYADLKRFPRPGHADYAALARYGGFHDFRGGGPFSGRLTAPLVFAGAVAKQMLALMEIAVGGHILSIMSEKDVSFEAVSQLSREVFTELAGKPFPVVDDQAGTRMQACIREAKKQGDSVGGLIECAAVGLRAGIGEPGFHSVESLISRNCFAIPGLKGIEFGAGFGFASLRGSSANDEMAVKDGKPMMLTNHNGGLSGGISTGMPLLLRVAMRPTPTISLRQKTVDLECGEDTLMTYGGRHDPCIVPRALPAVEAAVALALCEAIEEVEGQECWNSIAKRS